MKRRRKVLNVTYRKDSNTFEDWMKYEVEILNEDGSTEKIPAYGKRSSRCSFKSSTRFKG